MLLDLANLCHAHKRESLTKIKEGWKREGITFLPPLYSYDSVEDILPKMVQYLFKISSAIGLFSLKRRQAQTQYRKWLRGPFAAMSGRQVSSLKWSLFILHAILVHLLLLCNI